MNNCGKLGGKCGKAHGIVGKHMFLTTCRSVWDARPYRWCCVTEKAQRAAVKSKNAGGIYERKELLIEEDGLAVWDNAFERMAHSPISVSDERRTDYENQMQN